MRTAWALYGIGFLTLFVATALLLRDDEGKENSSEPTLMNITTPHMNDSSFTLQSLAFTEGGQIPIRYTCDGDNVSPPLEFLNIPEGTVSLVLIVEDPDVPTSVREDGIWDHWVLYNIPPETTHLDEGAVTQGRQGVTTSDTATYIGPCPPDREHRYFFHAYALDTLLDLPEGSTKQAVLDALEGHVLGITELMGLYGRDRQKDL